MSITTTQLKDIKQELSKLKPAKVTLDGNRSLTVREAIFALAPTPLSCKVTDEKARL